MAEQIFLPSKLNFNLCSPKSTKPTIVYAVVYFQGKQYKINTGVKVYPNQWNKQKQIAVISNCLSKLDNANNFVVNQKISEILVCYKNFLNYICNEPKQIGNFYIIMKKFLNKNMGKRKRNKTFEMEFQDLIYEMSEERRNKYTKLTQDIINYMKANDIAMEWSSITKEMLYQFACDMVGKSKKMQIRTYNDKVDNIYFLMNHADVHEYLTRYDKKKWSKHFGKQKDKRDEEEKQSVNVTLTDEQVTELYNTDFGTQLKNEVRDIFVFLCLTGLSEGDMLKIWSSDYVEWIDNDNLQIKRNKTGVTAVIPFHDKRVREIYERYKKGFPYTKLKGKLADGKLTLTPRENQLLNSNLHTIMKEVSFDYEIPIFRSYVCCRDGRIEVKNTKEMRMMSDEITMYDSRHTFITSAYYKGMPKEQIISIVGHTSTIMVENVYLKLDQRKEAEAKARRNTEFYRNSNTSSIIEPIQRPNPSMDFESMKKDIIENHERGKKIEEQEKRINSLQQLVAIAEQRASTRELQYKELYEAIKQGYGKEYLEGLAESDYNAEMDDLYNEPWEFN